MVILLYLWLLTPIEQPAKRSGSVEQNRKWMVGLAEGHPHVVKMFPVMPMHGQKSQMIQGVINDLDIQALVDNAGELTKEHRSFLMAIVESDAILKKRYDDLLRQKELLQAWWEETGNGLN